MKRSKRLERVSELGEREAESAGRQLAAAREAQGGAQALLQQLLDYRQEYRDLFEEQRTRGMDAQRYDNFQRFFDQLDRAIEEQRGALASSEARVEQHRGVWLEKRQHTEILARLACRVSEEEVREDQKREQQQADELFAQRHSRR